MLKKFSLWLLIFIPVISFAQKNDTVVLVNSNIITGEIRSLDLGLLTLKTSAMGTLKIKVEELKSLKSTKRFQIQLNNGYIYFGTLDTVNSRGEYIKIITSTGKTYITEVKKIASITQFRKKFFSRLSGNLSFGINYSKSSDILATTFSGNVKYWGRRRQVNLNWTDNLSLQADSLITNKQQNTFSYKHYVKKKIQFTDLAGIF